MSMKKEFSSLPPLRIVAYSDFYAVPEPRVWGDYWLKLNLLAEFRNIGYPLDESNPGILLHLFGEPLSEIPREPYKILWIHSHPDWVGPDVLKKYDKIFCISEHFIEKIATMGSEADFLMIPTNMAPLKREKQYDVVFVGNTKKNEMRKIVRDMGRPAYRIGIWGWGWRGLIPEEWYGGEYYENTRLNELYASAKIVLNDHHEDMRREGFINPRILDALASGAFVLSDRVFGIERYLGDAVAMYDSPAELAAMLERFLNDGFLRDNYIKMGQAAALGYSYRAACTEIIRHIESVSDKLSYGRR